MVVEFYCTQTSRSGKDKEINFTSEWPHANIPRIGDTIRIEHFWDESKNGRFDDDFESMDVKWVVWHRDGVDIYCEEDMSKQ